MHKDIISDKPGDCSKCGMELIAIRDPFGKTQGRPERSRKDDKRSASPVRGQETSKEHADHTEHHRLMAADFKKRFFVVLPLTLLVLALSFLIDLPGSRQVFLPLLGSTIVFYGGWPFFKAAKQELGSRNYGMMTLVSLAVLAGYLFSVAATFLFPATGPEGESLWWEISTLVLAFLFGHWLEMKAVVGAGSALAELSKLIPPVAHRIVKSNRGQVISEIKTEALKIGDLVLVKPGEKIPIDGEVVEGESSVNEAMITGESRPVEKKKGAKVIGGTINYDGSLTIKVTKIGAETAVSQITALIRAAQETKPAVQKLADKAANYLTLTAIFVGSATFVYWFLVNPSGAVFAATLAITVVVITCPHALGLAIPTVTTVTSALAARNGILIREMKGLEVARRLNYIVLDKTGTLTEGKFGVVDADNETLKLAAALEVHSEHSIGKGIVEETKKRKLSIPRAVNFKAVKGKGVTGRVNGTNVVAGNWKFVKEQGNLKSGEVESTGTVIYVLKDSRLVGTISLEDRLRPESKKAIDAFHKLGLKIAMLTGDKKEVGEKVGKALGIDTVFSEVLPEDKVVKVKELQARGYRVGMVGDGVNDAPALTQANVGVAIGAGTDVAVESAEIVLVKNNPLDIVKVIALSRATEAKMKQNLAWATGYNLLAIPAAAGVFIPWGITLRPEWGALLMSASSIIVVANALLLRRVRL